MANKPSVLLNKEEKKPSYAEYLQKSDVSQQVCDVLLKLVENQPGDPMLFMANYFDACADKCGKVASALQLLSFTRSNSMVFEANLLKAYDVLCTTKPAGSKKHKPGLIGSVYEAFVRSILSDISEDIHGAIVQQIVCRSNEVVTFDVFRYGVTACFFYKEYIEECKSLYSVLNNKQANTGGDKAVCDAAIHSFKSALDRLLNEGDCVKCFIEAGIVLGPSALAIDLLSLRESSFGQYVLTETVFLTEMTQLFISNLKGVK